MSGLFIQTDECDGIVTPDMRSRFSMSSAGSNVQSDFEEQQASDDQEDIIATGHNMPQLDISGNGLPQPTARASLLRHPSRRKGLLFPLSVPITAELATGTLDFTDDDDMVSETGSEDFDTTLRPQDAILGQELSTVNHGTDSLMRESLDTIRPPFSETSILKGGDVVSDRAGASNVSVQWPIIGQVVTNNYSSPLIVKNALSTSPLISQAYPASGSPPSVPPLPFGHGSRRKPAPRLEDYDKLYPTQPQPKTVTAGPLYTFPRSVPIACRPTTPGSEIERDTIRSKSRLPRFHAARLRESSPLRKILLPFSRTSRQATAMSSNKTFGSSQSHSTAYCPPPRLGSPIILSPSATLSGRPRTSSSPPQPTFVASLDLSYDSRYLSPASINVNNMHFNPTSSVPILPMFSTPGATPDVSSQFENPHTPRSLGPITPSSSGSVPTTLSRRRILVFGATSSSSELDSRASSRCSTPVHSLRSIVGKVMTLPSTIMKRTSSTRTVTQVAYTQMRTQAVSPGFSRTASPSPCVLGSPWMGSSDPDVAVSPEIISYYRNSNEMSQPGSVPSSRNPSRNVSPLPAPSFPFQPSSSYLFTPESPQINHAPSRVGPASCSPRFPPFMSPHMRQQSAEDTKTLEPEELDGYFRGRSKPSARVEGLFMGTAAADQASRLRSRSEGATLGPEEGQNPRRGVKHKGSFRSFLGLVKRPSAEDEASSGGSSDYGHQAHTRYRSGFLQPTIGENYGMIGQQDHKDGLANQQSSSDKGLGLSLSDSKWHRERVEMEVTMTRCLVELLDAEHTRDYKRVQAMIDDVRDDIGRVQISNEGPSDGEESIIDSYMQLNVRGEMREDAYDSENSLESRSRTLRAEDIATDISSLEQKPRDTRGGDIGYWYGMGELTDDIKP